MLHSKRLAPFTVVPLSCVCALDGRTFSSSVFIDESANRQHAINLAGVVDYGGSPLSLVSRTLLGHAIKSATCQSVTATRIISRPLTWMCWYKEYGNSVEQLWGHVIETSRLFVSNGTANVYMHNDAKTVAFTDSIVKGVWSHYAVTWGVDGTLSLYRDGVLDKTDSYVSDLDASSANLYIGGTPTSNRLGGIVTRARFYNVALSADEVKAEYNAGASAIQFKSEYGYDLSGGDVSSGNRIGPWHVLSGTVQIKSDTRNGVPVRVIEATSTPTLFGLNIEEMCGYADCAYGTFDFYFYKLDSVSNSQIMLFGNEPLRGGDASQTGYMIWFIDSTNKIRFDKVTAGAISTIGQADSIYTGDQYLHFQVVRDMSGTWSLLLDGTEIITGVENTHNRGSWCTFYVASGEKLILCAKNGDLAFTKELGARR